MADHITKVYGPPGTGKTTKLLAFMEDEIRLGVAPELVAFVTFSRDAIQDARRRAIHATNRLGPGVDDLPLFRTFHSLAWRLLGLGDPRRAGIADAHQRTFCDWYNLPYEGDAPAPDVGEALAFGDYVLWLDQWLTNNRVPLQDWRRAPTPFKGDPGEAPRYVELWRAYKQRMGRHEFHDVLEVCRRARPHLPASVLFVDEFQDLNPLQYALYEQWASDAERVYIAGDDDQTIYGFQGASADLFLHARADDEIVLGTTHRLSPSALAYAKTLVAGIKKRRAKTVTACACCEARRGPRAGHLSILERPAIETILSRADPDSTFILARTTRQVRQLEGLLEGAGVPFHKLAGPDVAGALWTRRTIAAKQLIDLMRDPTARLAYAPACSVLGFFDERAGYITKPQRDTFLQLPMRVGSTWPMTPLGEDLSQWSWDMLRAYFTRVPTPAEVPHLMGLDARQREALDVHVRSRPSWPITPTSGVYVGTIHASKGQQARTVILLTDIGKRLLDRVYQNTDDHDAEHRIFYVGATRALRSLVVLRPMSARSFFPVPSTEVPA